MDIAQAWWMLDWFGSFDIEDLVSFTKLVDVERFDDSCRAWWISDGLDDVEELENNRRDTHVYIGGSQ